MAVVALGADHAGFALKEAIKSWLARHGHAVVDFGTQSSDSVDYPDYAAAVASAVSGGRAHRGVLVCGTGIGMAIAANKVLGIRAAQCADVESARLSRQHNDANVLTLGARTTPTDRAVDILEAWLAAGFDAGRHTRRVEKITQLERHPGSPPVVTPEAMHAEAR